MSLSFFNITSIINQVSNSSLYNATSQAYANMQLVEYGTHAKTVGEHAYSIVQWLWNEGINPHASLLGPLVSGFAFGRAVVAIVDPQSKNERWANMALSIVTGAFSYDKEAENFSSIFLGSALVTVSCALKAKSVTKIKHEPVIANRAGAASTRRLQAAY